MVQVAFEDAEAYARWAGRVLPTEAQWEFAARGGLDGETSRRAMPSRIHDDEPQANHWRGIFPILNLGSKGYKRTSPVGCFPANGYGLYDMVGNVWQWTRSSWTPDLQSASASAPHELTYAHQGRFISVCAEFLHALPARRTPARRRHGGGPAHRFSNGAGQRTAAVNRAAFFEPAAARLDAPAN